MTAEHSCDHSAVPWRVIGVHDHDQELDGFAYTVGLTAAYGHPELLIHRDPERGDDDVLPYRLSIRDLQGLLNDWGVRIRDGESFAPGHEESDELDGGLTSARFRFGPPIEPEMVEAYAAEPDSVVLPVLWELRRDAPPSAATELTADLVDLVRVETLALADAFGVEPPADFAPSWGDRYGVWTPAIHMLFAGWHAAPTDILDCAAVGALVGAGPRHRLRGALGVAEAAAYRHGRHRMLRDLKDDCEIEIERLMVVRGDELTSRYGDDAHSAAHARADLERALRAYATALLLRDVLPDEHRHVLTAPLSPALPMAPLDPLDPLDPDDFPVEVRPLIVAWHEMTPAQMRRVAAAHRPLREGLRVLTLDAEVWATEQGMPQFWRALPAPRTMQQLSARDRDDFADALLCVLFATVARPFLTDDEARALMGLHRFRLGSWCPSRR